MNHVNPESSPVTSTPADSLRRYSDDFKRDAVRLITEEQYKLKAAAQAELVAYREFCSQHIGRRYRVRDVEKKLTATMTEVNELP